MARRKTKKRVTTIARHNKIRDLFKAYRDEKYKGRPKYSLDYCLKIVAEEMGYSEGTVLRIISTEEEK